MQITPVFSVGVGKTQAPELLPIARQLFADNRDIIAQGQNGLRTTLQRYNSRQDSATLNNPQAVESLKKAIKSNAINFYAGLGFDVEQLEFDVVNLWLNEMCSGSSHPAHLHYGFQLSGCFYVDVPQNSNLIKLYTPLRRLEHGDNPAREVGQYNAEFYGALPEEGDMLFWESLITHEVPLLEFTGTRRSIAYDLKISKKLNPEQLEGTYKMNLQDYIAIYNINNSALCHAAIQNIKEENWVRHSYSDPITGEHTTYADDLDISHPDDSITDTLQEFFRQCAKEYLSTIAPMNFPLQELTRIRFNRYKVGTNMKMHHDHIHTIFDGERKGVPILSFLALLNEDFEGGDFLMFDEKRVNLSMGDVIVFPSNFLYPHAVTTVTKGTRYSCVSWGY